jgi:glutamate--cysteine ligase
MSTLLETHPQVTVIQTTSDLHGYFERHAKLKGSEQVGIECEVFGVHVNTGEALPYRGKKGIEAVLKLLAREFNYEAIRESGHVIALKRGGTMISLEPGGQVELSAEPTKNLHQAKDQLDRFFYEIGQIADLMGEICWLSTGIQPFSKLERIEWVPKTRYQIMARYLGAKGKNAHDMMKRTATNQINLDYHSEEDAIEKMHVALSVTPIAAAMFSNSSFTKGKVSPYQSERLRIWRATDPDRCGLILKLICEHCTFQDYLNYVLDVPMIFVVRKKKWLRTRNLSFRKFIEQGFQGHRPTQDDFELHLSTIFTDARFKQFLEIRGMDGQPGALVPSVYAFWKGLLYSSEARRMARELLKKFSDQDIMKLHRDVERQGLKAKMKGRKVLELARELVRISEIGLVVQRCFNDREQDERIYLEPLKGGVLKYGKTSSDQVADLWRGSFRRDRKQLINFLSIPKIV